MDAVDVNRQDAMEIMTNTLDKMKEETVIIPTLSFTLYKKTMQQIYTTGTGQIGTDYHDYHRQLKMNFKGNEDVETILLTYERYVSYCTVPYDTDSTYAFIDGAYGMFPLLPSGSAVESELFRSEGQNPRGGQSQYSQARCGCDSHSRDPISSSTGLSVCSLCCMFLQCHLWLSCVPTGNRL